MCLKPRAPRTMPEEIGRWGQRMLSAESPYRLVGDRLYAQYQEEDYADLYPAEGQPALSPVDLAFVTVFQFLEDLSDRQAAQAVCVRLDWKYALHLSLGDGGFDFSVLSEYRDRLREHEAYARVFERLLEQLRELGLLRRRGRQRTDSTAILSKVRQLNRLERVVETLRLALEALEKADEAWYRGHVPDSWAQHYRERLVGERLTPAVRSQLEATVGQDGQWLLERLHAAGSPQELLELPAVILLQRVWAQQFRVEGQKVIYRDEGPYEGATRIQSPHDPEARYSKKKGQEWIGYKLQVTESDDDDQPHLLTDIAITNSVQTDGQALEGIQQRLEGRDLCPQEQLVDAGYVHGETLAASAARGITLYGPIQQDTSAHARQGDGFALEQFHLDTAALTATCPAGHTVRGYPLPDGELRFAFPRRTCQACPHRQLCCPGASPRQLKVGSHYELIRAARLRQRTEAFRQHYRHHRGAIEGTLSALVRGHGARVARYLGLAKEHLRALFTGAAMNLRRAARWLAGIRPQPRRKAPMLA